MNTYQFEAEDFALSESGIHLLRNSFNFKTIEYRQIEKATIKRSPEIKNTTVILIFGIALVCFAFYQSRWVVESFTNPRVHRIYIESIVLPILPVLLGVYCIYASVKKVPILFIEQTRGKHKLRLSSIVRNNQANNLQVYLRKRLGDKLFVDGEGF